MTRRGWLLFIALSLVWGVPYLFIKIAVTYLAPSVVVFGRVAVAAAILLPVAASRGALRPLLPHWRWVLVFAVVEITVPFGLLGYAELRLSSSLTALLIAGVPLATAVMGRILALEDPIDRRRLLGLAIGIAGVSALVGIDVRGSSLWAVLAMLGVVLGYASGPVLASTKLVGLPGVGVSAVAVAINTVLYAPWAWIDRPAPDADVPLRAWVSIVVLGAVCSALAFALFFALVAEVGPSRTTVITFVNPAVAVALGVIVLSEPFTLGIAVGFPLVVLGSWLATRRSPAPTPMADEPAAAQP